MAGTALLSLVPYPQYLRRGTEAVRGLTLDDHLSAKAGKRLGLVRRSYSGGGMDCRGCTPLA